jgi:uncharacterized protein (TIGR02246 family)
MPLTTEDRLDILDLYARQAWALDTGDIDAYVNVFAVDGVLDLASRHQGHAEIRKFAEAFRASDVGLPGAQHHVDQLVLDGDEGRCSVHAYVTRTFRMPGRGRNNTFTIWQGYYTDTLVKQAGRWLIHEQIGRAWEGSVLDRVRNARAQPASASR